MEEGYTIECAGCGWIGCHNDLVCSDEDAASEKAVEEIKFDLCPECGTSEMEDLED